MGGLAAALTEVDTSSVQVPPELEIALASSLQRVKNDRFTNAIERLPIAAYEYHVE